MHFTQCSQVDRTGNLTALGRAHFVSAAEHLGRTGVDQQRLARSLYPFLQPYRLQMPEQLDHILSSDLLTLSDLLAQDGPAAETLGQVDHVSQGVPPTR